MCPAIVSVLYHPVGMPLWSGPWLERMSWLPKGQTKAFFFLKMAHSTLQAEKNQTSFLEDQHFCHLLTEKDYAQHSSFWAN